MKCANKWYIVPNQFGFQTADTNEQLGPSPSLHSSRKAKLRATGFSHGNSSRSSIQILPNVISGLVETTKNPEIEYGTLQEGSLSSTTSVHKFWMGSENPKEDLYFWMAKQQEQKEKNEKGLFEKENFLRQTQEQDQIKGQINPQGNGVLQDSIKLLDAHLIFEPLLSCLGVMPQQMVNKNLNADISSLENFGTNLSLIGSFDSIRIDIVVSEAGDKKNKPKLNSKKPNGRGPLFVDHPSFLCERVGIELEVLKMSDGLVDHARQNVIYMSRRQLKKHTSTVVNFSLNIRYISQQVNMPLLRLLHQITSMYQNVKDAQIEFQEQPDIQKKSRAKDECSIASEPTDILQFADERYDKFNETISNHPMIKVSSRLGPVPQLTPSPNAKNRPQSFAQKLRSTSKTVKGKLGYTNLNETSSSPLRDSPTASVCEHNMFKMSMDSKQSLNGCGASSVFGDFNTLGKKNSLTLNGSLPPIETPNCWKTIYYLLDLYGTMPETKTVLRNSMSAADAKKNNFSSYGRQETRTEEDDFTSACAPTPLPQHKDMTVTDTLSHEKTRLIVFGVAKIHKTKLLAMLSGLKLEAEITTLNSSATWRKKARPVSQECSITGQVGRTSIVLLEGVAPNQQTVVKVTVGKSQTLYSSITKKGKDKNSGLLSIGPVYIDIPQHPVALHGMMTRSSKQLSSTLQELRVGRNSSRNAKHCEEPDSPYHSRDPKERVAPHRRVPPPLKTAPSQNGLLQPLVMQFNILLQSLSINAALLPSLQAQYRMNHVSSTGVTGNRAKFVIDLPTHTLSFTTKIQSTEMNLPTENCISLPQVHVEAEYIPETRQEETLIEGIILRQGGYLNASAEIGEFEKCLTTDLLNHLVFVQKVFMKEVNEVIQKVYGGEKPVPLWSEDSDVQESSLQRILFSLNISMKRIQLTATTPCSSAVRFETGTLELHLSNRVKNVGEGNDRKLFFKAQIDFNLALGQIIKNVIFDEAEPEFQQYAFFHTTIGLRNAFQDELSNEDKELILLKLKRPLLYIQPVAVDKAILVWLNYKNAYEYWTEKRANLNSNYNAQYDRVPFGHIASTNLSTLFLQLTVEDMGICLPLNTISCPSTWGTRSYQEFEPKGAVVITLENTIISACSSGSLVSKGRFSGLCLRFADDFETTLDDWKPNMNDNIMNLCVVSEGTYEVCSRTVAAKKTDNAKWLLNVKWQMEGVDIHLDVNIGKQLSSLGHTLTMLTGYEDEDQTGVESPDSEDGDFSSKETQPRRKEFDNVPTFVFDPTIDSKKRSLMMEKEMTEQLKIINDLRTLGASQNTIIHEERRLQELQAICYKYFRKDMMQKFKRPSIRRAMLKSTNRSSSLMSPNYEEAIPGRLDPIASNDEISSLCSTPGPSRTASLRQNRVPLNESMRQTSLPNAEIESEFNENDQENDDWCYNDSPPQINIDGIPVEMRRKSSSYPPQQKEPNIDFELDIKVLVNSGKCVLHTKEPEERILMHSGSSQKSHKRERSFGTVNDWGSPTPSRRNRDKSKLRYANMNNAVLIDLTIFHIPGLDVKLQYQSKTLLEDISPRKRANLFAWINLQSVPEETIISPHILEFLEQALEPIPTKPSDPNMTPMSNVNVNLDILPANYVTYASFPVDVIVYFHMQPSTFRFSCLPVSRVECMLQLPSLDFVFSSKRSAEEESNVSDKEKDKMPSGGLSITGCLADFNVYIFHPYGGKKSGIKEAQFSPLTNTNSERKDSLSINVEFVKLHMTRSRKLYMEPVHGSKKDQSKAVIRFSTIVDIGSASFKYDMRRLTEILAFPKAWYRRRIVRRLFLGDLSINQSGMNSEMDMAHLDHKSTDNFANFEVAAGDPKRIDRLKDIGKSSSVESSTTPSEQTQISAWETLVLFGINFTKLSVQMNMGNVMGNVVWLTKDFQSDGRLSIGSTGNKNLNIGIYLGGSSLDAKGGIVGGSFEVNRIDTRFYVKEETGMEPYHQIGLRFKALELRLDYMGTSVLMTRISSFSAALKDEWKTQMSNSFIYIHGDLSWDQLQIMISKSTTADILKMYYKLEEFFTQQFKSSKRVFTSLDPQFHGRTASLKRRITTVKGDKSTLDLNVDARHHRHWQKPLQQAKGLVVPTLVTRLPLNGTILGGTVKLRGDNISLACFHGINFKSKSWALFSLRSPCIFFTTEAQLTPDTSDIHVIETLTFSLGQDYEPAPQSHSMAIVSRITRNIRNYPPQFKTLNEWFQYAFANSDIDAVDRFPILERDRENAMNSIERVRGTSGNTSKQQDNNHHREVIFALPGLKLNFKTDHKQGARTPDNSDTKPEVDCSFITEFEDHIFVTVDADAFFFLHDLITSYVQEKEKVVTTQTARASSPNLSHNPKNHLKPLVAEEKNKRKSDPDTSTEKPVTEKSTNGGGTPPTADDGPIDLETFIRDWRHFDCKTWQLEPTVRLLSWAGKSIEPYGVDYILNKLGFSHARTTIPKWLQRGCMDPLDKVQSLLMLQLLTMVRENKNDLNLKK